MFYARFVVGLLLGFLCACSASGTNTCSESFTSNPSWKLSGVELAANPSFESGRAPWYTEDAEGWDRIWVADELYGGCGNWYAKINTYPTRSGCPRKAGVFQTIILNQTIATPLVISATSIGLNINGTKGSDYSVYADVQLTDGTFAYGFYAPFDPSVTLWQQATFLVQTDKPILSLIVYGLFRGDFVGVVYFDSFSVQTATILGPNLIVNPSFDGGSNSTDCSTPIAGWTNINASIPYITCPAPPSYYLVSPPGFIAIDGEYGLSGATQRVVLNQLTPRNITFGVDALLARDTGAGQPGNTKYQDGFLLITYIDGTTDSTSVEITITSANVHYGTTFAPTKPIQYVDVSFRYSTPGFGGYIYVDDCSLVEN